MARVEGVDCCGNGGGVGFEQQLDPDHRLVLRSSLPLLKSRNCGVVLAVCTLHYYCGTQTDSSAAQLGRSSSSSSNNSSTNNIHPSSPIKIY